MKKYKVEFDLFLVGDDTKWVAPAIYNVLETDNGENYYNFICKAVNDTDVLVTGTYQFNFTMELHIGDIAPSPIKWLDGILSDNLNEYEYIRNMNVVDI